MNISKDPRGNFVLRLTIGKEQVRFKGLKSKREAQRLGEHLEELSRARKLNILPPEYVITWIEKLGDCPLISRLVKLGLINPPKEEHRLDNLIEQYHGSLLDSEPATWTNYKQAVFNLKTYFKTNPVLEDITREQALLFHQWMRATPLNRRSSSPQRLSKATCNRRIGVVKQLFTYAVRIGWLSNSPFDEIKGGDSSNPEMLAYIPAKEVLKVMEGLDLERQLIIALGRFCGLRGPSEMCQMVWEDIHYKTADEPGWLFIPAKKNKRHGRFGRRVPLPDIVAILFKELQASSQSKKVFKEMTDAQNFSVFMHRYFDENGFSAYPRPWYNLRKSYCSDLLEEVQDIPVYEHIADHSYKVAVKHYQILHKGRMLRSIKKIDCFKGLEKVLEKSKSGSYSETTNCIENCRKNQR